MENFLDYPAKRTRSASGKISTKMASNDTTNLSQSVIAEEEELPNKAREGFVAGMVEQINNSPGNTPHNSPIKTGKVKEKTQHVQHDCNPIIDDIIKEPGELEGSQSANNKVTDNMANLQQATDTSMTQILQELNVTMKGIQTQLSKMSTVQQEHTFKVSTLEFVQKDEVQSMREVQNRLNKQEHTIEMLMNHVAKQDQRIQELSDKQNDFQARSMKGNMIISGIEEKQSDNCKERASAFFRDQLEIAKPIPIEVAHRIGTGENCPIIVKLHDNNDKQLIFQHSQKLKGTRYFISDQLPEELAEKKRQIFRIKGQNKKLPIAEQLLMNIKRDKLYINNEKFQLAVNTPTALTWLQMDEDQQKLIRRFPIIKGETNSTLQSHFISYAAEVNSVEEVQKAYTRVFLKEPRATHIVCAYLLPGRNFPVTQGNVDDREFGASRHILRKMQQGNYINKAVFVARYYGGTHLGPDRFNIYKDLAIAALDKLGPTAPPNLDVRKLLGENDSESQLVFQLPKMAQLHGADSTTLPTKQRLVNPAPQVPVKFTNNPPGLLWSAQDSVEEDHDILDEESTPKTIAVES